MRKAFYMIFAAVMMCSCGIYTKYEPQTSVPDNLYGDSLSYGTDTASLGNVYWREEVTKRVYFIGNERMLIAHDCNRLRFS